MIAIVRIIYILPVGSRKIVLFTMPANVPLLMRFKPSLRSCRWAARAACSRT